MSSELPETMEGNDLIVQEEYERGLERDWVDSMDKVDRRDRKGEIVSFVPNRKYRSGYDKIDWGKRAN